MTELLKTVAELH